jgi:hypothetical protein
MKTSINMPCSRYHTNTIIDMEELTFRAPYNRRKQEKQCNDRYVAKPVKYISTSEKQR